MVSQSIVESQEVDDEDKNIKHVADDNISSQAAAASKDSKGKEKILDKLKHELDKRLDSNSTTNQGSTDKPESEKKKKEDPEIEYKLRTKGVQVVCKVHS